MPWYTGYEPIFTNDQNTADHTNDVLQKHINEFKRLYQIISTLMDSVNGHSHNGDADSGKEIAHVASADSATEAETAGVCTGNAATATKLASPINIALTGNVTGNVDVDGSGNAIMNTTLESVPDATVGTMAVALGQLAATLTANGHIEIPVVYDSTVKKLIVNWGTVSAKNDANTAVTFEKSFSTVCLCALASHNHAFSVGNDAGCGTLNWTLTGMNVRSGSSVDGNVCWLAIGY